MHEPKASAFSLTESILTSPYHVMHHLVLSNCFRAHHVAFIFLCMAKCALNFKVALLCVLSCNLHTLVCLDCCCWLATKCIRYLMYAKLYIM